jgi:hypothetical protein
MGGLTDLFLGKKSKPDAITKDMRAAQTQGVNASKQGFGELNAALDNNNAESVVKQSAFQEQRSVLTAAQDARRKAQQMMAQRGLQGSSLGLAANRSIENDASEKVASINAQVPNAIRALQINDAQTRMNAGNGLFNQLGGTQGMNFNSSRSGGVLGIASSLAPLAGTVAGTMTGNPMAGAAAGQGLGALLSQPQAPASKDPLAAQNFSMGNYSFYK